MPELGHATPTKVLIGMPCRDELKTATSMCFSQMTAFNARQLPQIAIGAMERRGAMIASQRNAIVEEAIKLSADWILWLDSDMVFPPDTLATLLSHNLDFVGATYNRRTQPYHTLGHFLDPNQDLSKGGLVPSDRMPFGIMLTSIKLFQTLDPPWFFETSRWSGSSPLDAFLKMIEDNATVPVPDSVRSGLHDVRGLREFLEANEKEWGIHHVTSEDYNFCRKAVRAGYKLWCDLSLSYRCGHIGEQIVTLQPPPGPTTVAEASISE